MPPLILGELRSVRARPRCEPGDQPDAWPKRVHRTVGLEPRAEPTQKPLVFLTGRDVTWNDARSQEGNTELRYLDGKAAPQSG